MCEGKTVVLASVKWRLKVLMLALDVVYHYGVSLPNKLQLVVFLVVNFIPAAVKKHLQFAISPLRDKGVTVRVNGIKYCMVDEESFMIVHPSYEGEFVEILNGAAADKKVFLDIGAHIGLYSLQIAQHAGLVIALEPNPQNFTVLARNIKLNKLNNVRAFEIAAWNHNGKLPLLAPSSGRGSVKRVDGGKRYIVKTTRVDDLMREIGVSHVDLVKIDVEGAELEVLEGMNKTLKNDAPNMLLEISKVNERAVHAFLADLGYQVSPLEDEEGAILSIVYCKKI